MPLPSATPLPSAPSLRPSVDCQIVSIPQSDLFAATGRLDDRPLSEGGHKLGQGGFGTVYYCQIKLKEVQTEVAVKIFSENVSDCWTTNEQMKKDQSMHDLPKL